MKFLLVFVLLVSIALSSLALTPGEIGAIQALYTNFPSLGTHIPPWNSNASAACEPPGFPGLVCSDGPDPHVLSLSLDYVGFNGSLPSEIGGLLWLEALQISHSCTGQAPSSLWTLSKLKKLTISSTRLYDDIGLSPSSSSPSSSLSNTPSTQVASFPELEELTVENNPSIHAVDGILRTSLGLKVLNLRGHELFPSPTLITKLKHLTYLDISQSAVRWTLTSSFWTSLPALEHVNMSSTNINGELDSTIGSLSHLRVLDMSRNRIGGYLPPALIHCPLEALILEEPAIKHPLPDMFGYFASTMTQLVITNMQGGENRLPQSIGALRSLKLLTLSKCGFTGTLPANLSLSLDLAEIKIDNNQLTGSLPSFVASRFVDVHNNQFAGTIPASIASTAEHLILGHNQLGPHIAPGLLTNSALVTLDLSRNRFSGSLPNLPSSIVHNDARIDLSYNEFNGTIPSEYCFIEGRTLQLSNNKLSGPLYELFDTQCRPIQSLHLERNQFEGAFPAIKRHIFSLDISHNRFTGALPLLPSTLKEFKARSSGFSNLDFDRFALSAALGDLERLDLSGLGLSPDVSYFDLMGPKLQELSLADNKFRSLADYSNKFASPELVGIDLTNNSLSGVFPSYKFESGLAVLKIARNSFTGGLDTTQLPSLTQIDISDNQFRFDVADFSGLPLLITLNARSNQLYGSLMLDSTLENLQSADFSDNRLDQHLDLASIGSRFATSQLRLLNVSDNIWLPVFQGLDTNNTGLARTSSSEPSSQLPKLLTCYALSFFATDDIFLFDEDLFNYTQCDCNQDHFGFPPMHCYKCPSDSLSSCGATHAAVPNNSFAFFTSNYSESDGAASKDYEQSILGSSFVRSLWTSFTSSKAAASDSSSSGTDIYNDKARNQLEAESCLITTIQTLSLKSNCKGINITAEHLQSALGSEENLLKSQCTNGSEGRLCSKCRCNATGDGECWYQQGPTCVKCKHVFSLSSSLPLVAGLLLLIIIVASVIMALAMRRSRVQSLKPWTKLPTVKRIFYRLLYLTSLGNVSILITFLQILLAFTEWDAYMQVSFLGLMNADTESIGLRCLFPFLSDPLWALLVQLSIPFLVALVLALSVGIGSQLLKLLDWRYRAELNEDESESESSAFLTEAPEEVAIEYPALALLTSLVITSTKFLYFGTALAAHQYLFSVSQPSSKIKYVHSSPWMQYSSALPLILTSIPAIFFFDFGLPIAFAILCWKVRQRFNHPSVMIYFGSLFATYDPQCFWWEMVNIIKKLSIALVLKAFPATDALQSALVVSILAGTQAIQVSLNPWKRRAENIADSVSSLLLIGAMLASRPTQLSNSPAVLWYIFALSIVFVLANVAVITFLTITGTTNFEANQNAYLAANSLKGDYEGEAVLQDWESPRSSERSGATSVN